MSRKVIATNKAPQAIGPYSQAIQAGQFLFVSGQVALDPATGEVRPGNAEKQTGFVMENIKAILEEAGCSLEAVVKCTIYLKDLGDFATVNQVYGSFFKQAPPARATVQVSGLPKGVDVEIDAIVCLEQSG
ncbi:MAG: RidA family protein [bacterium]